MGFLSKRDGNNSNNGSLVDGIGQNSSNSGNGNGKEKRPPAKYWCNIGVTVQILNEETGELEDIFVSLGGIALDDLKPIPVKGSNPNWKKLAQAKNQLRENALRVVSGYEPGEGKIVPALQGELRRVAVEESPLDESGENEMVNAVNSAFDM